MIQPYETLEHEWAEWNGLDPAGMVACSSGTAALHLALEALRLPSGSGIVVPDFTMIACARAVTLAGHTPYFVDCDQQLLLGVNELRDTLQRVPRHSVQALMPVHVYGRRCAMDDISRLADKHDLFVIEDLAEAHGICPHPGTDVACWSFYKNKIIGGEEGGAVWFRDSHAATLARKLRCQGFTDDHDFNHVPRGHNYRLANTLASLIILSIRRSRSELEERRSIEGWYDEFCPTQWKMPLRTTPWVYDMQIPKLATVGQYAEDRLLQDHVVRELNRAGFAARHGFKPMTTQEEYSRYMMNRNTTAKSMSRSIIYLPMQPGVTNREDCRRAIAKLIELVG